MNFFLSLIFGSALVSSSEVAFFSLTPSDIKDVQDTGDSKSNRIIRLLKDPNNLLATILISNNLINIAIILVMAQFLQLAISVALSLTLQEMHQFIPFSYFEAETCQSLLRVLITVGLVTFILVLFGEVAPKVFAQNKNVVVASFNSRLLTILSKLFFPLRAFLVSGTSLIENYLGDGGNNKQTSMEDIDEAIQFAVGDDELAKEDQGILRGIVKFGDVPV